MEYATITSKYCCGIDLHARTIYLCVTDRAGKIRFHRNLRNAFSLLPPDQGRKNIRGEENRRWQPEDRQSTSQMGLLRDHPGRTEILRTHNPS